MSPRTWILARTVRGVGRISRASGTTDPATIRALKRMVTRLVEDGRLDLLRDVQAGRLPLLVLYDAYRRKRLGELAIGGAAAGLAETWEAWAKQVEVSVPYRQQLGTALRWLKAPQSAVVQDLPELVREARITMAQHPQSFNRLRSCVQAFARDTLGRTSAAWRGVTDIPPYSAQAVRRATTRRPGHPQTVAGLAELCRTVDVDVGAALWSMATTGMGPGEYWGRWTVTTAGIRVHGTKASGRDRLVPDIGRCVRPRLSRQALEDRLVKAQAGITPYDCRRSFAVWSEAAGIVRARRRLYLGHGPGDVTGLYEQHEIAEFLSADAERLVQYLARELAAVEAGPQLLKTEA